MCFAPYYSVNQLIEIKFILNKYAKITFSDDMYITHIFKLFDRYKKFIKDNENKDFDYPNLDIKFED